MSLTSRNVFAAKYARSVFYDSPDPDLSESGTTTAEQPVVENTFIIL